MDKCSLYRDACQAADVYRQDLVARLGHQYGETAVMEWNRDRWWVWAAERVIQHITGERFWTELDARSFASVTAETPERMRRVERARELAAVFEAGSGLLAFGDKQRAREEWARILNGLLD